MIRKCKDIQAHQRVQKYYYPRGTTKTHRPTRELTTDRSPFEDLIRKQKLSEMENMSSYTIPMCTLRTIEYKKKERLTPNCGQ